MKFVFKPRQGEKKKVAGKRKNRERSAWNRARARLQTARYEPPTVGEVDNDDGDDEGDGDDDDEEDPGSSEEEEALSAMRRVANRIE